MALNFNSAFDSIARAMQNFGLLDIVLPFLLIFTVVFATLQRVGLFKESEHGEGKKNINAMLSLIISILTVVPHINGRYPPNYDPIVIINALIPSAAVLAIVIILLLFLFGIFGSGFASGGTPAWIILGVIVVMGYIFGATVGWWEDPSRSIGSWWDSDLSALIIIIIVFALLLWFITSDEKETYLEKGFNLLTKRFK